MSSTTKKIQLDRVIEQAAKDHAYQLFCAGVLTPDEVALIQPILPPHLMPPETHPRQVFTYSASQSGGLCMDVDASIKPDHLLTGRYLEGALPRKLLDPSDYSRYGSKNPAVTEALVEEINAALKDDRFAVKDAFLHISGGGWNDTAHVSLRLDGEKLWQQAVELAQKKQQGQDR